MRNKTRNNLIGWGSSAALTAILYGILHNIHFGDEELKQRGVQITNGIIRGGEYCSLAGLMGTGAMTLYNGARAGLETWLDRYRASDPY